jgi:hypothetical protein
MGTLPTNQPPTPARDVQGDSGVFVNFMRRLVQVPHSEVKAKLDAEKEAKRVSKRASRVPNASSKAR